VLRAELDQLPFSAASFDLGLSFGARQPGRTDPVTELLRVVEPQGLLLVSAEADETQVLRALLSERRGQVAVAEEHDLAGAEVAAVQPRGRTGEEPVTVASRRGDDWVPGSTQTRVILMASDAPLPAIEPVAVADDLRSTEQWLQYDDEQRRLIRELEIRIRELEGLLAERNRIRGELRLTEQVLAVRIAGYEEAVQTASLVTDERYRNTISWKLSSPLRLSKPIVKRLVRRVMRSLV
ncbi:MAG: hypothetical protein J2P45_24455, partial [Candidatus Dormibacteraeota bacterium]|nr:hypothetical protein [Candidatus Dormibacteraeota bacterium]